MKRTIKVTIKPGGEIEIKPHGFGEKCADATKFLEKLGHVKSDKLNAEYFERRRDVHVDQKAE